ncbi:STAS domain-containing protein [Kitasatospora sp. NPDC088391]|uniref:STAS domain-containing protein n=1 Tax=Kitasatospora sp. NPDC088391 TaxID=3364074 RepID=UPI00382FFFB0
MSVLLRARTVGSTVTATLAGEINSTTSGGLQAQLLPLVAEDSTLLVDLRAVDYISSAGLRTLLIVHRQAQRLRARIVLVGLTEEVRFVMSATGFLDFFQIGDDLEDGLEEEPERVGR